MGKMCKKSFQSPKENLTQKAEMYPITSSSSLFESVLFWTELIECFFSFFQKTFFTVSSLNLGGSFSFVSQNLKFDLARLLLLSFLALAQLILVPEAIKHENGLKCARPLYTRRHSKWGAEIT